MGQVLGQWKTNNTGYGPILPKVIPRLCVSTLARLGLAAESNSNPLFTH